MKKEFILPQRAEKMSVEEQKEVRGGYCKPKGENITKSFYEFWKKIIFKK